MNRNRVELAGRLTRDPETTQAKSGITIAKIRLAVNSKKKGPSGDLEEEATFLDVTFFDRVADVVTKYLKKGDPLFIDGRLVVSEWEDKETGKKRSRVGVVAHSFEFMPREPKDMIPPRGEPDQKKEQESARPNPYLVSKSDTPTTPLDEPESDEHDEIPF